MRNRTPTSHQDLNLLYLPRQMAEKSIDYKAAGVDYAKIDPLKIAAQRAARETAGNLAHTPYRAICAA